MSKGSPAPLQPLTDTISSSPGWGHPEFASSSGHVLPQCSTTAASKEETCPSSHWPLSHPSLTPVSSSPGWGHPKLSLLPMSQLNPAASLRSLAEAPEVGRAGTGME